MAGAKWTANDIPDQTGRNVIVTGGAAGIGKEAARVFAGKGAAVMIATRGMEKAERAQADILSDFPQADVSVRHLDLADLSSVKAFADSVNQEFERLDVLVNNAGIMMCPFAKTMDGFEIQMGTNHFGHFALTGRLLPLLKQTPDSRLVVVSSLAHKRGAPDLDDLNWEKREYKTADAYCDSKLANLLFVHELVRRLGSDGPLVTAAHPGWTATDLQRHSKIFVFMNHLIAQGVEKGALPTLRAAIDETARPGDYFGPGGFQEMRGWPVKVEADAPAHHGDTATRLWRISEDLTGVSF